MAAPVNDPLWRRFDEGRVEAVLGGYAVDDDPTWRDRPNLLLAIRQLMMWAQARGRLDEAAAAFMASARRLSETAPFDLIDLLWSYTLVCTSDRQALPADHEELRTLGEHALAVAGDDERAEGQVSALKEALEAEGWPISS